MKKFIFIILIGIIFLAMPIVYIATSSSSMENSEPFPRLKYYDMSDVIVIVTSHENINLIWKLLGGLKKHPQGVWAFSYYHPKRKKYIVMLPFGASESLIGHEFAHILKWKNEGINKWIK